jgi:hypothetical protein
MADGVDDAPQVVPDRSLQSQAPDAAGLNRWEGLRPASVHRIPPGQAATASGRARAGRAGTGKAGTGKAGTGKAGTGSDTGRPGMPKRVRGAQLAGLDLGEPDQGPDLDPTPERSRLNLRSFQLEVDAARRVIDGQDTTDHDQNEEGE